MYVTSQFRTPPLGPMSPMGTPAFGVMGGPKASPSVGPAHEYDPFRIRKPQSHAPARTKIICTLGPKSQDQDVLEKLLDAGMNVARLNFSHGSYEVRNLFLISLGLICGCKVSCAEYQEY